MARGRTSARLLGHLRPREVPSLARFYEKLGALLMYHGNVTVDGVDPARLDLHHSRIQLARPRHHGGQAEPQAAVAMPHPARFPRRRRVRRLRRRRSSATSSTVSSALAAEKARTLNLLQPVGGQLLLDVGCGQGADARHLAAAVGPAGQVVGLDLSRSLIREARRANAGQPCLEFAVADAQEMPFADSSFDGSRTERVLQHVEEPSRVLAEMCRVVAPGWPHRRLGPDWGSLVMDSSDPSAAEGVRCDLGGSPPQPRHRTPIGTPPHGPGRRGRRGHPDDS